MAAKHSKWMRAILVAAFFCLLAMGVALFRCLKWEGSDGLPLSARVRVQLDWKRATELVSGKKADRDAMERSLAEAGFAVLDSDLLYPEYLANSQSLSSFWKKAAQEQDASASLFRVTEEGKLRHLLFLHRSGQTWFYTTEMGGKETTLQTTVLPVYEMKLTDWGIFYYRCYPAGDPHYIDYSQIRMEPADRECYDLTRKYILPVGYQLVNLFLVDWQEGQWENVSFNDLVESLYEHRTGERFDWESLSFKGYPSRVQIPEELFEQTILPYFTIPLEELRSCCGYEEQSRTYPWRPIHGDDLTVWNYPLCEPEVVSWKENSDGTLILEVQVSSPDLMTNRLFCHQVTVRPLEEGFQYVSNRITYVSQRGLPPAMARFELDG